jgi:hypothetical protein
MNSNSRPGDAATHWFHMPHTNILPTLQNIFLKTLSTTLLQGTDLAKRMSSFDFDM